MRSEESLALDYAAIPNKKGLGFYQVLFNVVPLSPEFRAKSVLPLG